jgi:hypothetical protein
LAPLLLNELQREHGQLATPLAKVGSLKVEMTELRRITTQLVVNRL